mgnify:CR=1 FL=1
MRWLLFVPLVLVLALFAHSNPQDIELRLWPFDVVWVAPRAGSRFAAELSLHREARSDDQLLCFHGLPPLRRSRAHCAVHSAPLSKSNDR